MSKISRVHTLLLAGLVAGSVSCRHTVSYKPSNEGRVITHKFDGNLRVVKFADAAPKHPSINLNSGKEHWKTNAQDVYKNKEYAGAISRMIARDLAGTGMFSHVLGPDDRTPHTDFVLMGTVWDYSGVGRWKKIPENAVIFSSVLANLPGALIAAAATSGIKTEVVTNVILTDVRILHLATGKVLWTCPPLRAGGEETVRWSKANPDQLAKRVDKRLQEVVTDLVNRLQRAAPAGLRR
jgi:hypothetical protein